MKWIVCDSLYCPEQFFCSHLDSYSRYLREARETVARWNFDRGEFADIDKPYDVAFVLDRYGGDGLTITARRRIAQVAAICSPMPWEVRKTDGSPAYDLVISSIPWMVDEARAKGCRAEYMPLAFDTRARACGMGVKRDLDCIFIGTVGPNHQRRTELLRELSDVVTVLPPVFGREYFRTLARAKVVFNVHAEWARGAANNMRIFEAGGMGCEVASDGRWPDYPRDHGPFYGYDGPLDSRSARLAIEWASSKWDLHEADDADHRDAILREHCYENRIPRLIELARSL